MKTVIQPSTVLALILSLSLVSFSSLAQEAESSKDTGASAEKTAKEKSKEFHKRYWEHKKRGFFTFSPRYFSNANNRHHSVFSGNGFGDTRSGMANFHFTFGRQYDSGFETGIVFSSGGGKKGRRFKPGSI